MPSERHEKRYVTYRFVVYFHARDFAISRWQEKVDVEISTEFIDARLTTQKWTTFFLVKPTFTCDIRKEFANWRSQSQPGRQQMPTNHNIVSVVRPIAYFICHAISCHYNWPARFAVVTDETETISHFSRLFISILFMNNTGTSCLIDGSNTSGVNACEVENVFVSI